MDADALDAAVSEAYRQSLDPSVLDDQNLVLNEFRTLADRWLEETSWLSSATKILKHPAYLEIIELGRKYPRAVVRLIFRELQARPASWFEALKAIVGRSPVPPDARTDPKRVREAWLQWGRDKQLAN